MGIGVEASVLGLACHASSFEGQSWTVWAIDQKPVWREECRCSAVSERPLASISSTVRNKTNNGRSRLIAGNRVVRFIWLKCQSSKMKPEIVCKGQASTPEWTRAVTVWLDAK